MLKFLFAFQQYPFKKYHCMLLFRDIEFIFVFMHIPFYLVLLKLLLIYFDKTNFIFIYTVNILIVFSVIVCVRLFTVVSRFHKFIVYILILINIYSEPFLVSFIHVYKQVLHQLYFMFQFYMTPTFTLTSPF